MKNYLKASFDLKIENNELKQQNDEWMEALRETSNNLNAFYSQMGIENDPIERIVKRNNKLLKQ